MVTDHMFCTVLCWLSSLFLSSDGSGQSNGKTRDIGVVQGSGIGVGSIVVGSDGGGGDGSGGEDGGGSIADGLDGGRDRDLMDIRDSSGTGSTFNVDIGLSGDVFMDIGLGLDLLMDIGLSSDLLINIGLSGDILMDIGLGNGVQLRVGYRGIISTGIDSGKGSNSSGNGLVGDGYTTVGGVAEDRGGGSVSIVVGIGIWATEVGGGQHTSRSRGNKAKGCNEGLHV